MIELNFKGNTYSENKKKRSFLRKSSLKSENNMISIRYLRVKNALNQLENFSWVFRSLCTTRDQTGCLNTSSFKRREVPN